jgi:lysophospholipase L1-like esterase
MTAIDKNRHPIRVVFFGDSICVGQGVSLYKGWVTQIAKAIDEYAKEHNWEMLITSASVNGRTTRQALEDMPYQVQSHGADIILIQFGLNDCNYWETDKGLPRVSLAAFKANLLEIIERAKRFGALRIILNTNHPTLRKPSAWPAGAPSYQESVKSYNDAIRQIAVSDESIILQDFERHFETLLETGPELNQYLLADGLHLNERGHGEYYRVMLPTIMTLVSGLFSGENGQ